jgi:hypothetical protein
MLPWSVLVPASTNTGEIMKKSRLGRREMAESGGQHSREEEENCSRFRATFVHGGSFAPSGKPVNIPLN